MNFRFHLIAIIFFSSIFCENRNIIYESIEKYLKKYRYTINNDNLNTNNGIIRLELISRRTNINSQVLLGFYAIGRSLITTDAIFNEVHIVIQYDNYNKQQEILIAPTTLVRKLSTGQISSKQFFHLINI